MFNVGPDILCSTLFFVWDVYQSLIPSFDWDFLCGYDCNHIHLHLGSHLGYQGLLLQGWPSQYKNTILPVLCLSPSRRETEPRQSSFVLCTYLIIPSNSCLSLLSFAVKKIWWPQATWRERGFVSFLFGHTHSDRNISWREDIAGT